MKKPVVTAINGAAMGGGAGLAIAGDLAVMSASARIGYPEAKHGIVAAIAMANLVRQVGRKAAFELVALGEPIGAAKALALGGAKRRAEGPPPRGGHPARPRCGGAGGAAPARRAARRGQPPGDGGDQAPVS